MIKLFIKKILLFRLVFFKKINTNFYSQFGEDKILNELIPNKFTNGFYVDVGCFHPKKYSNTYILFRRGWRGINIDMEDSDSDIISKLEFYLHNQDELDKKTNIGYDKSSKFNQEYYAKLFTEKIEPLI